MFLQFVPIVALLLTDPTCRVAVTPKARLVNVALSPHSRVQRKRLLTEKLGVAPVTTQFEGFFVLFQPVLLNLMVMVKHTVAKAAF